MHTQVFTTTLFLLSCITVVNCFRKHSLLAMAVEPNPHPRCDAPSPKERITALREHDDLFETIAKYPQAAIYERFRKEWAFAISYVESKVHRCARAAYASLRQNMSSNGVIREDIDPDEPEHTRVMDAMVESLLLHCMNSPSYECASSS
jgi:hypothetical protein